MGILEGGYAIVSRAVRTLAEEVGEYMKSKILLGVNVICNMDNPNQCRVTAITLKNVPSLPSVLASRVRVSSAINFVKDVRSVCGGSAGDDKTVANRQYVCRRCLVIDCCDRIAICSAFLFRRKTLMRGLQATMNPKCYTR